MIGELEAAFLRACPSIADKITPLREDRKIMGIDQELPAILDAVGYHLGSTVRKVPNEEILRVLKVVERVLADGNEHQKWAVTHFLLPTLQSGIRQGGHSADALLPHLGEATRTWWIDLNKNPRAAEDW